MDNSKNSYDFLKPRVLSFLETLKEDETHYNFSNTVKGNIYSSIIALYTLDLLGEVKKFSVAKRQKWIDFINSYQDVKTGYFKPEKPIINRPERNYLQLTTFSLSALRILDAEPYVDPPFKEELKDWKFIMNYLMKYECLEGKRGSGNMAMFLGILLTYFFEKTNDEAYKANMLKWFDVHNQAINSNGFWGEHLEALYYNGVQNGFHQYVIYDYWKQDIIKSDNILKVLRQIQDFEGHFAPFPGGAACEDFDAIHLLIILSKKEDYVPQYTIKQLKRAKKALIEDLNNNGGFCQTKKSTSGINLRNILFLLEPRNAGVYKIKLKKTLGFLLKRRNTIRVDWFDSNRRFNESNLWDTWFKLLGIAEIDSYLGEAKQYNFQKNIGLGNFLIYGEAKL